MLTRRAIIDIGTVSTRLMVADVAQGGVEQICKRSTVTNLGEGLVDSGVLSSAAIGRVETVIDAYLEEMLRLGVAPGPSSDGSPRVIAVATSAARDASNSDDLARVLSDRNIPSEVISGDREASIAFAGATCDFRGEGLMVCDVGGGSAELIIGNAPADGSLPTVAKSHSFDVGCRRVTEMFLKSDPPTSGEMSESRSWVRSQFEGYLDREAPVFRLIGVGGTATTMVSMLEEMETYDSARVHGRAVSEEEMVDLLERLSSMDCESRRMVVGIQEGRAEVIVAGLVILMELLVLAGVSEMTVSESDGLLGLMMDWPS